MLRFNPTNLGSPHGDFPALRKVLCCRRRCWWHLELPPWAQGKGMGCWWGGNCVDVEMLRKDIPFQGDPKPHLKEIAALWTWDFIHFWLIWAAMLCQPWWEGALSAFSCLNALRPRRRVLFSVCRAQFSPLSNQKPQFFYGPQLQGLQHKISASVTRSDLLSSIYVYFMTKQEGSVLVCGKGRFSVSRPWWTEIQRVIKLSLWKCLLLEYKYY